MANVVLRSVTKKINDHVIVNGVNLDIPDRGIFRLGSRTFRLRKKHDTENDRGFGRYYVGRSVDRRPIGERRAVLERPGHRDGLQKTTRSTRT